MTFSTFHSYEEDDKTPIKNEPPEIEEEESSTKLFPDFLKSSFNAKSTNSKGQNTHITKKKKE